MPQGVRIDQEHVTAILLEGLRAELVDVDRLVGRRPGLLDNLRHGNKCWCVSLIR